jgi:type VI protein secretion system component VasK
VAQSYLSQASPIDRLFRNLIEDAGRSSALRAARLSDFTPRYAAVLTGPTEVDAPFTREGYRFMQEKIRSLNPSAMGESCVYGGAQGSTVSSSVNVGDELRARYIREYITAWKTFLTRVGVAQYRGLPDASSKLEIQVSNDSPLLALLFMVHENTSGFPEPPSAAVTGERKADDGRRPDKGDGRTIPNAPLTTSDIVATFQPAHSLFSAAATRTHFVDDKNQAYILGLSDLQRSLLALAQSGASDKDAGLNADAKRAYNAGLDKVRQMSLGFDRIPEIDPQVGRLLGEPIKLAENLFVMDMTKNTRDKTNGELNQLCGKVRPLLRKYPFDPGADTDAAPAELASVFSQQGGAIWLFVQQHLTASLEKKNGIWSTKPDNPTSTVQPDFLRWLNRASAIDDALFSDNSTQPSTRFTLKALPNPNIQSLTWNGERFTDSPKQFVWPGEGVLLRVALAGGGNVPFANYSGPWGVFQLMSDADPRPPGGRRVSLTKVRGQGRRSQPSEVTVNNDVPVSVQLEIVQFPGGVEGAFDKSFFTGLGCPLKAIQ